MTLAYYCTHVLKRTCIASLQMGARCMAIYFHVIKFLFYAFIYDLKVVHYQWIKHFRMRGPVENNWECSVSYDHSPGILSPYLIYVIYNETWDRMDNQLSTFKDFVLFKTSGKCCISSTKNTRIAYLFYSPSEHISPLEYFQSIIIISMQMQQSLSIELYY